MNVIEWIEEIDASKKRDKDFRKEGQEILDIYSNEKNTPFNILYSNTETLLPALFSQVPRPAIQRRYKDNDQLGRHVSEASQRMLEYLVDTDIDQFDTFNDSMVCATLDGLLPGRGVTKLKYETDDDWETVCTDSIKWDRVHFGYADKWSNVPWVAYEEYLDEKEAERLFPDTWKNLTFVDGEDSDDEEEQNTENDEKGNRKTALVYQIWDKTEKKIVYISPQYRDEILKEDDDPLELTGFFNCPKPLQFVIKSNDLSVTALYKLYENQAKELNRIQIRLNRIVEAIKARGVYNGTLGAELEQVLSEDDNALIPAETTSALMDGGFAQNIWMLPIGELIQVAQSLIQARESAKRVIYEITGISDIVRGQSMASETLGAQQIKEAWGTMRLKRLQKSVQQYALDSMKIMLDIAIKKFSEESWVKMTGLPYSTTEQREQAQQLVEIARVSGMQPDPQAVEVMQQPYWGDILKAMKDSYSKSYRVDIETNSTLDVEATEDKQQVAEFMNAFSQFTNGIAPMIEKGTMPFGAAKSMMLAIVKRYRFGREVEDELMAMKEPQQQQSPEQEKAIKEFQQAQQKFQGEQEQFQQEKQKAGDSLDEQARNLQADRMQFDFDKKLAIQEIKGNERLSEAKQQVNEAEAKSDLKVMMSDHKRDIQSMLDKHKSNVESCMASIEKPEVEKEESQPTVVNIENILPQESNKNISIQRDESGLISGASTEVIDD